MKTGWLSRVERYDKTVSEQINLQRKPARNIHVVYQEFLQGIFYSARAKYGRRHDQTEEPVVLDPYTTMIHGLLLQHHNAESVRHPSYVGHTHVECVYAKQRKPWMQHAMCNIDR
eukprot:scaffold253277_cov73-Attheya_sp.AAC.1